MRAFIIRPFGTQGGIDFDEVSRVLIVPALEEVGAEGRETLDIVESGNIRVDMFRRLLTADLVVADLSIHNANVFYELGIRHALRDHGTFMLRCDADRFPFDLQTDRYFVYGKEDPAASLAPLVAALRRTMEAARKDSSVKDSPVFASLPNLTEPKHSLLNPVPQDFGEEVGRAAADKMAGDLALLSYEAGGFEWEMQGWRLVGGEQFRLKAWAGARDTWNNVRALVPEDLEANLQLGTIFQRLGNLTLSTQAIERALANRDITRQQRAEAYALLARNAKTRWRADWGDRPPGERAAEALRSPHLRVSFENYERAFNEDLNHYYPGLNALAMLKVMVVLAEAHPEVWGESFRNAGKAEAALEEHREHAAKLAAAVDLALKAAIRRIERKEEKDDWALSSAADLECIIAEAPLQVAAYRKALSSASSFNVSSMREQLAIYRDLGVLDANLAEVFKVIGEQPPDAPRRRVLLFAGHMIDAPDRKSPRFPAHRVAAARARIREAVEKELHRGTGVASGYAGGASGGDILFHEVCAELGIPTRLYLAVPPQTYVRSSVQEAGPEWVDRFWRLYDDRLGRKQVRVLSEAKDVKDEREHLPAWLRARRGYGIWQRNNLWMLYNALDEACAPGSEDPNVTLIALWDGAAGDGPGGTGHLVDKVKRLGARCDVISTQELFGL